MALIGTLTPTVAVAALTISSLSSSSSSNLNFVSKPPNPFLSPIFRSNRLSLSRNLAPPRNSLRMDSLSAAPASAQTQFMVDMTCEGCVKAVKNKLETVDGVKSVEVDLSNQVVRVLGSSPVKIMADALEQIGRKAWQIGQGNAEDFLVSAAVSEFKGLDVFGVVRVAPVNMELAKIEANFSGLSPGKHGWSINEFGYLTKGAMSTGKVFNPTNEVTKET